jgi:glutamine amidotransferase
MTPPALRVAIVDYGLGNLYSVERACAHAGVGALITSDPGEVARADGIVLPGVGAFGDAMATLRGRGLAEAIQRAAEAHTPIMGICLGVQLLMSESSEFGRHEGLGLVEGPVVRLDPPREGGRALKVPEICWNQVHARASWAGTPLEGVRDGEYMYFVHSYCVQPADPSVILSTTCYGQLEFCSSLRRGNVFACQFHPERSGVEGLRIYGTWARLVRRHKEGASGA